MVCTNLIIHNRRNLSTYFKKKKSIHLESFLNFPKKFENLELHDQWTQLLKIRDICNLSIEEKRANKEIGSSLESEIKITANSKNFELLEGLDLAEYFITSKAEKIRSDEQKELKIEVKKANGTKCPRCWKILKNKCTRCEEVISEKIK